MTKPFTDYEIMLLHAGILSPARRAEMKAAYETDGELRHRIQVADPRYSELMSRALMIEIRNESLRENKPTVKVEPDGTRTYMCEVPFANAASTPQLEELAYEAVIPNFETNTIKICQPRASLKDGLVDVYIRLVLVPDSRKYEQEYRIPNVQLDELLDYWEGLVSFDEIPWKFEPGQFFYYAAKPVNTSPEVQS